MQRKILAVGQSPATIEQIKDILPTDGFKVIRVETCDDAITMLDARTVLVLLHPQLGGEATLPFINVLRGAHPNLPIILLGNRVHLPTMLKGLRMGANDVIETPLDAEIALARIKTQLELRDLLEAREMEIDDLRQQKAAQERLVRMVTHDLKHPMGNIRMAEGLLRHYMTQGATDKGSVVMDSVLVALDSMQETLKDFSDAFRLNQGLNIAKDPISLARILHNSVLEHLASATAKSMTIQLKPTELKAMADPNRLRRVVDNLVSNAIKYSPPGSTIQIWVNQIDNVARICVQDEGPGIPPEERHLLFTEFGKLSTRPTGEETSTGLGLWIVKMFVEAMGGRVGMLDGPEKGTIFWVDLPITRTIDVKILETQEAEIVINYEAS